ncbi:MAG TPA: hypothetical protein VMT30_09370 [Candidatus Saccharimonadia bacterium]|nr:hypothetical protein [Candidatus Saccharimonadia bacterium]
MTPAAPARTGRPMQAVDLVYRDHRYRIVEPNRENGASVRAAGDHVICAGCFKKIAPTTKRLADGHGLDPHCLKCAISTGMLVHMPACIEDDQAQLEEIERQIREHAQGTESAESREHDERNADARTPDHRSPDLRLHADGDDPRLVGPNVGDLCERRGADGTGLASAPRLTSADTQTP